MKQCQGEITPSPLNAGDLDRLIEDARKGIALQGGQLLEALLRFKEKQTR
jgi:hypothetical protein